MGRACHGVGAAMKKRDWRAIGEELNEELVRVVIEQADKESEPIEVKRAGSAERGSLFKSAIIWAVAHANLSI
jgi:hypothetical protein